LIFISPTSIKGIMFPFKILLLKLTVAVGFGLGILALL